MSALKSTMPRSILFVCMGNICRSPTAEAVTRALAEQIGIGGNLILDSAGTHDYHVGGPPDARTTQAAARRGYDLSALRARQVCAADFVRFDSILAMDNNNLAWLRARCPAQFQAKLHLFLEYAVSFDEREVPDPYYGGPEGFDRVLDLVEDAARGLIAAITAQ